MTILSGIIADVLSDSETEKKGAANIIEFCEESWGLGITLFPVQRFILKMYYNIPLDNSDKRIQTYKDLFKLQPKELLTEYEYAELLYRERRLNIHPDELLTRKRNELILILGRGSGKTSLSQFIGAYEVYRLLSHQDPQDHYSLIDTATIGLQNVAPTESQSMDLFQGLTNGFKNSLWLKKYMTKDNTKYVQFRSDADIKRFGPDFAGTIRCKIAPAVAGNVRGGNNIVVIFDELAHFLSNDGKFSDSAIYSALTPSTSRFKNDGKIVSISSPLVRSGKLWDLYNKAFDPQLNFNSLMLQIPTWECNVNVDSDYLRSQYADDPKSYIVEFGSQFTDTVKAWIDHDRFMACIDPNLKEQVCGIPGVNYYLGIDVGLKNDSTVFAVTHPEIYPDPEKPGHVQTRFVLDTVKVFTAGVGKYVTKNPLDLEDMAEEVLQLYNRFNIRGGLFDQWAGIPFQQALKRRGITRLDLVNFTDVLNSEVYRTFEVLYLQNKFYMYQHDVLIEQMKKLQATYKSNYKISVDAPQKRGEHDDMADALVRSVWYALTKEAERPSVLNSQLYPNVGAGSLAGYQSRNKLRQNYVNQRASLYGNRKW